MVLSHVEAQSSREHWAPRPSRSCLCVGETPGLSQVGFSSFGVFQLPREEPQHLGLAGLPRARAVGHGGRQVSGPQSDGVLLSPASSLSLTPQTLNQTFLVHKTLSVSAIFHGVPNQKMQ